MTGNDTTAREFLAGLARLLLTGSGEGISRVPLLSRSPRRPPRLELVLGPFFTLTVGSLALRGVTELASGQALTGAKDLFDFLLIFPTVALGLIAGYLIASRSGE